MSLNSLNQSGLQQSNPSLYQTIKELLDAQDSLQTQVTGIVNGLPYSAGNWTPTLTFAVPGDLAVVYTIRQGYFVKIGKKVFLSWIIQCTPTFTTSAGTLQIIGLPFQNTADANDYAFGALVFNNITAPGYTDFTVQLQPGTNFIIVVGCASAATPVAITAPNIVSGTAGSNYSGFLYYDTQQ